MKLNINFTENGVRGNRGLIVPFYPVRYLIKHLVCINTHF